VASVSMCSMLDLTSSSIPSPCRDRNTSRASASSFFPRAYASSPYLEMCQDCGGI
jgi:hypothetical protein